MVRVYLILLLSFPAWAQLPNSFAIAGASWEQKAPRTSGWMSYAIKLTGNNTYSYTTEEVTLDKVTMRTGLAQVLLQSGPLTILALGDGGVQTASGDVRKSLSYGAVAALDLAKIFKGNIGLQIVVVIRPSTTGSGRVYQIGIGKSF